MSTLRTMMFAAAGAFSLMAADTALAQGAGLRNGSGPVGASCGNEISRLCAGLTHGGGAVRGCLQDHRSQLSRRCRNSLDNTGWGRRRRWM